jgi:uncharacterized protein YuzE
MAQRLVRMTYDAEADAAYLYLTDPIEPGASVSNSVLRREMEGSAVIADFDHEDRLLGMELLGVRRLLRPQAVPSAE